jgi:hypothetical protein
MESLLPVLAREFVQRCVVSTPKKNPKTHAEMSPDEREEEHVRRLQEEVDAVKSGVLRRGKQEKVSASADDEKEEK